MIKLSSGDYINADELIRIEPTEKSLIPRICATVAMTTEPTDSESTETADGGELGASAFPPVLDACCGPRMMWFDKADDRAVFYDERDVDIETPPNAAYANGKTFRIRPTVKGSFVAMPFDDETFFHVVFDPPHLLAIDDPRALIRVQYGQLFPGWKDMIRQGFAECFRVLKPGGTLIFKWCEIDVRVSEVLALTPAKPLYGHRSGKASKTHWIAFLKPNDKLSHVGDNEQ